MSLLSQSTVEVKNDPEIPSSRLQLLAVTGNTQLPKTAHIYVLSSGLYSYVGVHHQLSSWLSHLKRTFHSQACILGRLYNIQHEEKPNACIVIAYCINFMTPSGLSDSIVYIVGVPKKSTLAGAYA